MVNTYRVANRLARHYATRDPFQIARERGYIIIDAPLEGIRGFHQYVRRCHIIYLDDELLGQDRRWVCAHELGHAVMHQGLNRVFMDAHTLVVTSRYEIEADHFAVDLLFSDEMLAEYRDCTVETTARVLGVSEAVAAYRLRRL